ncbi:MAG: hypothetical protein AMXMBFR47_37130 [Planctomycetota bacterium]
MNFTLHLAQFSDPGALIGVLWIVLVVLVIASFWGVFAKAGQPGWLSLIPIVNIYILCKIAGRPGWWLILMLIPLVNLIVAAVLSIDLAKSFGKGLGFGIGLWLLGIIFYPLLAFGPAQYQGPARG